MSLTIDPYYSGSYTVTQIANSAGYCPIYDYSNTNKMLVGTSKGFDLVELIRDSITKKITGISATGKISNYISTLKGQYPIYGSAYLDDYTLIYTDLQGYVCQVNPGDTVVGKRDKDIYIRTGYSDLPMSYFAEPGTGKILATVGTDNQAGLGQGTVYFFIGEYKNSYNYPPYKDIILTNTGERMSGVERGSVGMVRVPLTSALFPNKSFLIIENGFNVYSCEYDSNLKPIPSTKRRFCSIPVLGTWPPRFKGGFIDPITNDLVLSWSTYLNVSTTFIISGFAAPTQQEVIPPNTNCYSAGDNSQGSFGLLNNITPLYYFTKIGRDKSVYSAKAGQNFSVILQEDGKLFGTGLNDQGQLGNPSVSLSLKFIQIGADSDWSDLAVGGSHIIALKSNGDMYGCGSNSSGQLGQVVTTTKVNSLTKLNNTKWSKISSFNDFTFGIASDGTLWSTGDNSKGQLGRGTKVNSYLFRQIGTDTDWVDVSCGYDFTYAIKSNGEAYAVGNNEYGQLGIGNTFDQLVFTKTGFDKTGGVTKFRKVSAGTTHAMGLTKNNLMYGVGYNLYGELGLGDKVFREYFTKIGTDVWSEVSAGSGYTLAIKSDSTLWGTGSNYLGVIGLGSVSSPTKDINYTSFTQILLQSVNSQPSWFRVFGSYDQSIALTSYSLTSSTTTTSTTTTSTTSTTTTSTTSSPTTSTTSTSPIPLVFGYSGYYVAGSTDSRGTFAGTKTTDKLNFYYEITYRSPVSDISYNADRLFGLSNSTTTGYVAGGYTTDSVKNLYSSKISKINYATDVTSLDSSTLLSGRYYGNSLSDSDSNKGYISGGYTAEATVSSTDLLDFSTDVVSSNTVSNLSSGRAIMASFSDGSAKGFYLGGISGNLNQTNYGIVSIIDKIIFATDTCSISSLSISQAGFGAVGLFSSYGYGYYAGGYTTAFSQIVSRFNFTVESIETLSSASISLISFGSASLSLTYIKGFVSGGKLGINDSVTNTTISATYRMLFSVPEAISGVGTANLSQARWGLAGVTYSATASC